MDFDLAFGLSSRAHGVYRSTLGGPALTIVPWYTPPPKKNWVASKHYNIIYFWTKIRASGSSEFAFPRLNIATKEASLKKVKVRV
jgi:hypothetical protein